MASKRKVWGIDIGQVALKALRCSLASDGKTLVADAYDYIEYPKILSQPEADPEELIREALEQFLSRNELRGDLVAIAVPGQAGLSRFFKPPPVDEKTLPDIVKYEVRQQIPFPIEDVIWDWQRLGGTLVDGIRTDAEIGLFAMKRDAVFRALKPFTDAKIDVDIVQLAPLATFNVVCHDILETDDAAHDSDTETTQDTTVVVGIGTDTTDLIVTNGTKLWIRNIPIGGNHFTKHLSRELKLTVAKAEHLKRNARKAEDPKTVFQAMRPVFNDLVTEIQRSLSFYQSMEKSAQVQRIVLLGNAAQLPGLRQFMTSQLQLEIAKVSDFKHLSGPGIVDQKSFTDNILSLGPCYGLCLQGLRKSKISTNLLPQEFMVERMIEAKKPWVLASVASLMLGSVIMLLIQAAASYRVSPDFSDGTQSWKSAMTNVNPVAQRSKSFKSQDVDLQTKLNQINAIAQELSSASETQTDWLELFYAVASIIPRDPRITEEKTELPFADRKEIYLDYVETKYFPELFNWYMGSDGRLGVQAIHDFQFKFVNRPDLQDAAKKVATCVKQIGNPAEKPDDVGVFGPGWVVELHGHHYHNSQDALNREEASYAYIIKTLLANFVTQTVKFEGAENEIEGGGEFMFSDFGVFYPTLVSYSEPTEVQIASPRSPVAAETEQDSTGKNSDAAAAAPTTPPADQIETVRRCDFVVQFAWIPRSRADRVKARELRLKAESANPAKPPNGGDNVPVAQR